MYLHPFGVGQIPDEASGQSGPEYANHCEGQWTGVNRQTLQPYVSLTFSGYGEANPSPSRRSPHSQTTGQVFEPALPASRILPAYDYIIPAQQQMPYAMQYESRPSQFWGLSPPDSPHGSRLSSCTELNQQPAMFLPQSVHMKGWPGDSFSVPPPQPITSVRGSNHDKTSDAAFVHTFRGEAHYRSLYRSPFPRSPMADFPSFGYVRTDRNRHGDVEARASHHFPVYYPTNFYLPTHTVPNAFVPSPHITGPEARPNPGNCCRSNGECYQGSTDVALAVHGKQNEQFPRASVVGIEHCFKFFPYDMATRSSSSDADQSTSISQYAIQPALKKPVLTSVVPEESRRNTHVLNANSSSVTPTISCMDTLPFSAQSLNG